MVNEVHPTWPIFEHNVIQGRIWSPAALLLGIGPKLRLGWPMPTKISFDPGSRKFTV